KSQAQTEHEGNGRLWHRRNTEEANALHTVSRIDIEIVGPVTNLDDARSIAENRGNGVEPVKLGYRHATHDVVKRIIHKKAECVVAIENGVIVILLGGDGRHIGQVHKSDLIGRQEETAESVRLVRLAQYRKHEAGIGKVVLRMGHPYS